MQRLLKYKKYKILQASYCRILTHPVWGSAVYPATMFILIDNSIGIDNSIVDGGFDGDNGGMEGSDGMNRTKIKSIISSLFI